MVAYERNSYIPEQASVWVLVAMDIFVWVECVFVSELNDGRNSVYNSSRDGNIFGW